MRRQISILTAAAVVAASSSLPPAYAQDGVLDRTPQECIRSSRIRSTRVVDDRTILFYMRGGDVHLNELPNTCPGLSREDRFSYQTRVGQLCHVDTITVLELFGGGFLPGPTCRLGEFHPLTAQEAAEIVAGPEGARRGDGAVGVEEVELPDEDESPDEGAGDEAE